MTAHDEGWVDPATEQRLTDDERTLMIEAMHREYGRSTGLRKNRVLEVIKKFEGVDKVVIVRTMK